jgi:hypothetical protein
LAKKRVTHRGDSTNREAKRGFMVKIARLDEEAATQGTGDRRKEQVAGMGDAAFVHQVEISPCTVIMGNILGRKKANVRNTKISRINAI